MKGAEIIASPQVFPLPFLAHVNYVEHVYADKLTFVQHSKKNMESDTMPPTFIIPSLT